MKKFIAVLAVVASLAFAGTASAATSPGNINLTVTCNHYYHTVNATTSFMFDRSRYPNGGKVRVTYAYRRLNSSYWYYVGPLYAPGIVRPDVRYSYDYVWNRGSWEERWVTLDGRYLPPTGGQWRVFAKVEVLNGTTWESTGWTEPRYWSEGQYYGEGWESYCDLDN